MLKLGARADDTLRLLDLGATDTRIDALDDREDCAASLAQVLPHTSQK